MFYSTKDKMQTEHRSNIIYHIVCSGRNQTYVGKLDNILALGSKNLVLIMMNLCFYNCQAFCGSFQIFMLSQLFMDMSHADFKKYIRNTIWNHFKITDINTNCSQLCFRGDLCFTIVSVN